MVTSEPAARVVEAAPWGSAITEVDETRVFVRGRPMEELLAERISFGSALLLLWTGRVPDPVDGELINACLVASIDHGPTAPSALAARNASSTRQEPIACVASGLLSLTAYHGAGVSACMEVLARAPEDGSIQDWAETEVANARAEGRRIPGIGHRSHPRDVRSEQLLRLIPDGGDRGDPADAVRALAAVVSERTGRDMPVNIDGAVAACLCHVGLEPEYGNLLFALARSAGLAAHTIEERVRQRPMRTIDPTAVTYDGPPSPR